MLSAREWLRRQRRRDDAIGDLARELAWDRAAPKKNFPLYLYLLRRRPQETREAAREYLAARATRQPQRKPPAHATLAPADRRQAKC